MNSKHPSNTLLVGDGHRVLFKGVDPRDGVTPWLLKRCRARESEEFHAEVRGEVGGRGGLCGGGEVAEMGNKNHPNLLRLLGYCNEQDKLWRWEKVVVYECMPGGSLLDKFGPHGSTARVPLTLQQRLGILIGVARGLEYLHSFGLVHRSVSLRSISLDGSMQAKLAGFDYVTRSEAAAGREHAVVGEPGYVDPQLELTRELTPTNDLYSLGVVLLQLLSGRIFDTSGRPMQKFFRDT
ncbi:unnamed protein product, partial [Closterium sp. NIES-64]